MRHIVRLQSFSRNKPVIWGKPKNYNRNRLVRDRLVHRYMEVEIVRFTLNVDRLAR